MRTGEYKPTFWQRLKRSLEGCRPHLSLRLCLFEEQYDLDFFGYLIPLPFMDRWHREPEEIMESWGVYHHERAVWFCWGNRSKVFHLPWDFTHIKHEVRRPDGSWVPYVGSWEVKQPDRSPLFGDGKEPDGRWQETYPYRYVLESGEVQERTATVYVERREWRWRWFSWLPWPARKRTYIDVAFNDEVGERTGSWKGGTLGCGWDMKKGETPLDALRRMERERKFR